MATLLEALQAKGAKAKEKVLQGVEDVGAKSLEAIDTAKSKAIEAVDTFYTSPSKALTSGGEALSAIGKQVGQTIAMPIDYGITQLNKGSNALAESAYQAVKGTPSKMADYTPADSTIASSIIGSIGATPGNVISGTGRTATALSDLSLDINKAIGGDIDGKQLATSIFKNTTKAGAEGVGTIFQAIAPVFAGAIGGVFESSGVGKLVDDGKTYIATGLADKFGITGESREGFIEGTKSLLDLVSTVAGIKGSMRANKTYTAKDFMRDPKTGSVMTGKGGKAILTDVPATPSAGVKARDVALGTLQASIPEIGYAIAGEYKGSEEGKRGFDVARVIVPTLLNLVTNSPMGNPKGKTKNAEADKFLQEQNDAALKADQEVTTPVEKSKEQIAIDSQNKQNSESKTVGVMTPELLKEYQGAVKSGYKGSAGDFLKSKSEVVKENIANAQTTEVPTLTQTLKSSEALTKTNKANDAVSEIMNSTVNLGRGQRALFIGDRDGVNITVQNKDGKIFLEYISSTVPGKGNGEAALSFLKSIADKYGVGINGKIVSPKDSTLKVDSKKKLTEFYSKNGFTVKGGDISYEPRPTPEQVVKLQENETSTPTLAQTLIEQKKAKAPKVPKTLLQTLTKTEPVLPDTTIPVEPTDAQVAAFDTPPGEPTRTIDNDPVLAKDLTDIKMRNELNPEDIKSVKAGNWFEKLPSLTFGGMLDSLQIAGRDFSSYMRGLRGNNIAYSDKILRSYLDKNQIDVTEKRINVEDADIIGGKFPNNEEGKTTVEAKDVPIIKENFKQNFNNLSASLTANERKALADIGWNETMYVLMSNDQAKLDKYFSPEYQAKMQEKIASEKLINDTIGQMLVDRGLLSQQQFEEKDYVRFFLSDKYLEQIGKGKIVLDLFGDGPREFNSAVDALRAYDAARSLNKKRTGGKQIDINEDAVTQLNSIFKAKGGDIDVHRFHSPTLRTLNYSKYAGQAMRDADILKTFESLVSSKDKGVKGALEKMLGSTSLGMKTDNVVTAFLGLGQPAGLMAKTANAVSKGIMFGRIGTLYQAFTSTGVRATGITGIKLLANKVGISPASVATILNPFKGGNNKEYIALKRIMESHGIIGEFELFDKGVVGSTINKGVEISSGAPVEQAFKMVAGLAEMQAILKQAGVEPKSNNALDIAETYDAWSKDPANKETFLTARNAMEDNMRWIGDVSKFSKTPYTTLSSAGFQALKPYLYGKVNNIGRDYNKIYKALLTKEGVKGDAIGPAARQLGDYAIYYIVASQVANMVQSIYGTDDEVSEKIGESFASKNFGGNPGTVLRDVVSGGLSNPAFQGLNITVKSIATLLSVLNEKEGATKDATIQMTKAILSSLGIVQPADLLSLGITDGTILANTADLIGAVNPEGQSSFGYASGTNKPTVESKLTGILNMSPGKAVSDILYRKLGELEYNNTFGTSLGPVAFQVSKMLDDTAMPITQLEANIKGISPWGDATNSRLAQYAVRDVMKPLSKNEPITLTEFIAQSGIDKDTAEIISEEIPKMWMTEAKGNEAFAKAFGMEGGTYDILRSGDFGATLRKLEEQNPALFNSVIAGFAKMKESYDGQELEGTNAAKQVQTMFDFTKESAPTAAAISALRGTDPNITSLSLSTQKAMAENMDLGKLVNPESRAKAIDNLKKIDDMFATVYNNQPITDGIERSMALTTIANEKFYRELFKQGDGNKYPEIMPNILGAIQAGLTYRGFAPVTGNETATTPLITPTTGTMTTPTSTGTTSTTTLGATPTLLNTLQAYKPLKIENKPTAMSLTTQAKTFPTLASLLQRK